MCVLRATSGSSTTSDSCSLGFWKIETLPDDILLCIFDSYRQESEFKSGTWPWHVLAHVCQRWRHIVFAFPVYLNLRLECKSRTAAKAALDIRPSLPIVIKKAFFPRDGHEVHEADIIGALEYHDRIAGIELRRITTSRFQKCVALMQETFPILTYLSLSAGDDGQGRSFTITTSDAFLGGSARLQKLYLSGIRFPALPKLSLVCQ